MLPKEELDAIRERWKPGTLFPPQSVLEFLGHAGHDINKLLAYIEELETTIDNTHDFGRTVGK